METMNFYNKHYITVDERSRIVNGFSDAFRSPSDTDICINEQGGYQFRLFPGGEENPPLHEWPHMIPLYKYENGEVVKRTEEEIGADVADIPVPEVKPTTEERVSDLEDTTSALEDAICEMDAANEERMAAIEDALCEIDMG